VYYPAELGQTVQADFRNYTRTVWPRTYEFGRACGEGHISRGSATSSSQRPSILRVFGTSNYAHTVWHTATKFYRETRGRMYF